MLLFKKQINVILFPFNGKSQFEFHIHADIRKKYVVDDILFASSGNVIFPHFRSVRELASKINQIRKQSGESKNEIRAGHLNAMGLIDEINHVIIRMYEEQENPGVIHRAYQFLKNSIGEEKLEKTLQQFLTLFPPSAVYKNQQTIADYFLKSTDGKLNKEIALEEMMMLFLSNFNPACTDFKEFFDDSALLKSTEYASIISLLEKFFTYEKPFGPEQEFLFDVLKKPILKNPNNLEAQLKFIKEHFGILLSSKYFNKISVSLEFTKEEEEYLWKITHQGGGAPVVETFVPGYKKQEGNLSAEERKQRERLLQMRPEDYIYAEHEQFTPDTDWMPNVVLIAKNIYVWLDQLSKKYQREIKRLDQIPDEELDQLARWSFTSLWLIGVWERSHASKRIKQITGNLDAVSSAYSLYDYEIARDIGGEESYQNLNHRCWQRGIRLAGDMVPNHMGIFSKWVIEHPEYFIQSEHPPYPGYKFTGENLSEDPNIELRIEDGYWSRSDAAVVFQRVDRRNGEVRYVYHGNDGTSMPWNDTAQLNLLRADVREAVIQNILHVARKFSVIRFDAAMTLAKKHFQRLWYPMPGTSGVPSRQDHSLSRSEFDRMFPVEFWREVVDRFNKEMPQTLLLAEAFWLMEGYFVRTLGMHRVYNSAFMHMLMKEENEKFRSTIKNTLEFNPEILKRYVNFMSNPDEQTAVEQFGKDDKYFGVATLMITLPGLPMFAHGQIEGFKEKYGMEYQRAYYNEIPDEWLIHRHEYEVFPLTKKRYLFSQVTNFEFYDFHDDHGYVNENVITYSNRAGKECAVVFFHNKFAECKGFIKHSVPKAFGDGGNTRTTTVTQALQFQSSQKIYYRFRDRKSMLEYLCSGKELADKGIRVELKAFDYAVFTDFHEIFDETGEYEHIAKQLAGKGTRSLDTILKEMRLQPFHSALKKSFLQFDLSQFTETSDTFYGELEKQFTTISTKEEYSKRISLIIERVQHLFPSTLLEQNKPSKTSKSNKQSKVHQEFISQISVLLYCLAIEWERLLFGNEKKSPPIDIFQILKLDEVFRNIITHHGIEEGKARNIVTVIQNLSRLHNTVIEGEIETPTLIEKLFSDFDTASFLNVNEHNGLWYFNKEQFEMLSIWILDLRLLFGSTPINTKSLEKIDRTKSHFIETAGNAGYMVEQFKELIIASIEKKNSNKKTTKNGKASARTSKKKVSPVKKNKTKTKNLKKAKGRSVQKVTNQ
ncbi:MAG: alpha-amylase family glycosyl hydrolase [Bacteroidota bacterium]|nr:alpha-amylase family glycosyl hydrolase [Bacteroidota bacterium]